MNRAIRTIFINAHDEVRNGWKALGFITLVVAISMAFNFALKPTIPFLKVHAILLPGSLLSGLIMLIPTALCLRAERAPFTSVGLLLNRRWFSEAAVGTALGMGLMILTALAILALGGFHWERNLAGTWPTLLSGAWLFLTVAWGNGPRSSCLQVSSPWRTGRTPACAARQRSGPASTLAWRPYSLASPSSRREA